MLSNDIIVEVFNIRYKPDDMLVTQIAEELERYQLVVYQVMNNDHAITYKFKRSNVVGLSDVFGYLRIDRIKKLFEICASFDGSMMLPIKGDWLAIHDYLLNISYVAQE